MIEGATTAGAGKLNRSIGLVLLTAYGIGVTIGAGIYVLIGEVAGAAGLWAPASFVVAGIVAGLTALSFGELAVRFPVAEGAAAYAAEAFGRRALAPLIGFLILAAGLLSSATIALGAAGYINALSGISVSVAALAILVFIGAIAGAGIRQSVLFAAVVTAIEVGGLLIVFATSLASAPSLPTLELPDSTAEALAISHGVLGGALLAFFAFIGFEDMVHVAEEVRRPERTLPAAIILTLLISGTLYLLIATFAVAIVPPAELAQSEAPIALVADRAGVIDARLISIIAAIAALNGIIVQVIMGSRLIYGLAERGHLPKALGAVNARTKTPLRATLLVVAVIAVLALLLPIRTLAAHASEVTLFVFAVVNAALVALKLDRRAPQPSFRVPIIVPILGAASAAGLLLSGLAL